MLRWQHKTQPVSQLPSQAVSLFSDKQAMTASEPVSLPWIVSNRCHFMFRKTAFECVCFMKVESLSYWGSDNITATCSAPMYMDRKGFPSLFPLHPDLHFFLKQKNTRASLCLLLNRTLVNCQFYPLRRYTAILHIRLRFVSLFLGDSS